VNINGISQDLDFLEWEMIMRNMSLLQMDIFGLTETDINFNNKDVLLKVYDATRANRLQVPYTPSTTIDNDYGTIVIWLFTVARTLTVTCSNTMV
jgi:hypothetical protein